MGRHIPGAPAPEERTGLLLFQALWPAAVQGGYGLGYVAAVHHIPGKAGRKFPACDFPYRLLHDRGIDVDRTVVQRFPVYGRAVMVVPGIKENQIPGADIILFVTAPEMSFSASTKPMT